MLATNVEFWSAVILDLAEVPPDLFTPMFTCARVAGWSAHILEQKREGKLIRPTAKYVGAGPRSIERASVGLWAPGAARREPTAHHWETDSPSLALSALSALLTCWPSATSVSAAAFAACASLAAAAASIECSAPATCVMLDCRVASSALYCIGTLSWLSEPASVVARDASAWNSAMIAASVFFGSGSDGCADVFAECLQLRLLGGERRLEFGACSGPAVVDPELPHPAIMSEMTARLGMRRRMGLLLRIRLIGAALAAQLPAGARPTGGASLAGP